MDINIRKTMILNNNNHPDHTFVFGLKLKEWKNTNTWVRVEKKDKQGYK